MPNDPHPTKSVGAVRVEGQDRSVSAFAVRMVALRVRLLGIGVAVIPVGLVVVPGLIVRLRLAIVVAVVVVAAIVGIGVAVTAAGPVALGAVGVAAVGVLATAIPVPIVEAQPSPFFCGAHMFRIVPVQAGIFAAMRVLSG